MLFPSCHHLPLGQTQWEAIWLETHYYPPYKWVSMHRKLGGKAQSVYLKGQWEDIWHIISYWKLP